MNELDKSEPSVGRWCVIGAGPSGLTALKNLLALGIDAECLERDDDVGGNWRFGASSSAVLESTRLISSSRLTEYADFRMPREWPAHPTHSQCLEYLRDYARHFGLVPSIRTHSEVVRIERAGEGRTGWVVDVAGRGGSWYEGVVIATGHNREPRFPGIAEHFTGVRLHACDYKSPTNPVAIAGKRVLVIGGGNSGCDIAVECSRDAVATWHSTRRGYHVVPRFLLGRPSDLRNERLLRMGAPLWLRRAMSLGAIDRAIGLPHRHGLPRPDHRLWETHPVINDSLYERIDAGAIRPVADVARFEGDAAIFTDGSREQFDVVIFATGYRTTMPFIDVEQLGGAIPGTDGVPDLFMHMLHPVRDDVAVVGLIQPDSGQWGITDVQARLVARMAVARRRGGPALAFLHRRRAAGWRRGPVRYVDSPRHVLEVEHHSYRRALSRIVAGMDRRLRATSRGAEAAGCRRGPRGRG
jgi:cation diffusion facilitator CzcD-associated flavoprotein CzcO